MTDEQLLEYRRVKLLERDKQISKLIAVNIKLREDLREDLREEPVAWCQMVEGKVQDLLTSFEMKDWLYDKSWIPLYLAPPKREPLSEATIAKLWGESYSGTTQMVRNFARAIEKAHGIGGEPLSNEQKRLEAIAIKQREAHGITGDGEWQPECCICKTNENVEWVGGYQAYRCNSKDCIPL